MNKCSLISDLLPLYIEGLLSDESKNFVDAHIATCPDCKDLLNALGHEELPPLSNPSEKEQRTKSVVKGYRRWFYTLLTVVIISSLLGGIIGTYFVLKYDELVPTHVAKDFVTYALKGDRWVYQEKVSQELKDQLTFDQYFDWETWEDVESYTDSLTPTGFKVYKNIVAQEFGPIDVSLRVGLILERGGFRVFRVTINDKAAYLEKKKAFLSELDEKGDVYNVEVPPTDPLAGEYFVEGRILSIQGNQVEIEQHLDAGSREVPRFEITDNTLIVRHRIVNDQNYFDRTDITTLTVGDIVAIIFTKEDTPRAILLMN